MSVIEKAVAWAIETANDQSHGYSQANRWGPDYDCSSFVITAFEQAGVPVREAGASYTGNMRGAFLACGFVDVTGTVNLQSGAGLQPGDVPLNYSAHTCLAVGGKKVANCRTNEGHPHTGDQSGNEIRIQPYWNFPWNCVLRYAGGGQSTTGQAEKVPETGGSQDGKPGQPTTQSTVSQVKRLVLPALSYGSTGDAVCLLQAALNLRGFDSGKADGEFGPMTQAALNRFKQSVGLPVNGRADPQTWAELLKQ